MSHEWSTAEERIRYLFRHYWNGDRPRMAKQTGMPPSVIRDATRPGRRPHRYHVDMLIDAISKRPDVNPTWLKYGPATPGGESWKRDRSAAVRGDQTAVPKPPPAGSVHAVLSRLREVESVAKKLDECLTELDELRSALGGRQTSDLSENAVGQLVDAVARLESGMARLVGPGGTADQVAEITHRRPHLTLRRGGAA